MDGQRFDDLARALGRGASRRQVLAGFAGAALGLIGIGRVQRGAAVDIDWTGRYCGGIGAFPCPYDYTCVDNTGDGCDPYAGGADCSGVCVPAVDLCASIRCAEGYYCCNECGGTCEPIDPYPVGCEAVLCIEGTHCCDVCGQANCVSNDVPCPLAFCAGEECNGVYCGAGEYCCNYSCSICAPYGGGCPEIYCGGGGEVCGDTVCAEGQYCCNPTCGICAPLDGACIMIACID
jgi:hypothetical protein